jgi:putative membrane protein
MFQYGSMPSGGMPGGMQPGQGAEWMEHATPWWDGPAHLLPFLLFAMLIGVLVWGIIRLTTDRAPLAAAVSRAAAPPAPVAQIDAAGQELRVRYARGDITREEYLTRSADLGLTPGPTPEEPTQE